VLSARPPTRAQLATLLFDEADDPLGAVRWGLSEIRRALGGEATVEGDPLPGLGSELFEAHTVRSAAGFECAAGDAEAARLLAADVDNPQIEALVMAVNR
jgi:hypothetical protein